MTRPNPTLSAGAFVLAAINLVYGQEKPYTQPPADRPPTARPSAEADTLNKFFNGKLPDAIGKSKISLNSRLRWESADQDSLAPDAAAAATSARKSTSSSARNLANAGPRSPSTPTTTARTPHPLP